MSLLKDPSVRQRLSSCWKEAFAKVKWILHGYGYDENGPWGIGYMVSGIVIPFRLPEPLPDAYLAAARPGGHDGVACQRNGSGSQALAALFACHLLQLGVGSLALVQRYVLQVVHAGRWIINRLVLRPWKENEAETTVSEMCIVGLYMGERHRDGDKFLIFQFGYAEAKRQRQASNAAEGKSGKATATGRQKRNARARVTEQLHLALIMHCI